MHKEDLVGRRYERGKQREAIIQVTSPPSQKPLAWFPRVVKLSRRRERGRLSRLYARLIGESGARCADWHPHKAAISPPGCISTRASSISNHPRVACSLVPRAVYRDNVAGLILEDHSHRGWFSVRRGNWEYNFPNIKERTLSKYIEVYLFVKKIKECDDEILSQELQV